MQDDLRRLTQLQLVDDELGTLQAEADAIPSRRAEFEGRRQQSTQRLERSRQELEASERERRRLETQLADQEELVRRLERQQFEVKTNQAYGTMLREIERARTAISDCETGILECMEAVDTQREAVAAAEESHAKTLSELEAQERALTQRAGFLGQELARVKEARQRTAEGLSAELLARYDRIAAHHGPAVVVVSREVCQGCRVGIPPQHFLQMLQGEKLLSCHSCHRILVHERFLEAGGS